MRVLICTDRIGALASADAGAALGRAFVAARPDTQVAVVPAAVSGVALAEALAALGDTSPVVSAAEHADPPGQREPVQRGLAELVTATTVELGESLAAALESRPRRVVVDLTASPAHDAGAGLLHALGATADVPLDAGAAGLAGITRVDCAAARALVGRTELVAVVPTAQLGDLLLGLRGLTARRGHTDGADPALMLATDAHLGALAAALGVADAPGLGAAGGAVLALNALGAWPTSGPALCAHVASLERTAAQADVIVTGADTLDFATRGGEVVGEVAVIGGRVLRPCVAVAREVFVSARELRTFGIEVAYALGGPQELDAAALTGSARGMASSWTW